MSRGKMVELEPTWREERHLERSSSLWAALHAPVWEPKASLCDALMLRLSAHFLNHHGEELHWIWEGKE